MTNAILSRCGRFLRSYSSWQYSGKSRKTEKQRLELVRHLFAKYPVPRFLEQILASTDPNLLKFADWYIAVAQGDSLYKTCTRGILSKRETYLFLQAPNTLSIKEAIWWAKTMALSNDVGLSFRMARSSVARHDYQNEFWIDAHRFFTNNPVSLKEMDELLDYVMAEHRDNNNWTIKKRSLASIRRKSEEWHRAQYKMKQIGRGSWEGMDVPDWKCTTGKFNSDPQRSTKIEWFVRQILTGKDLAKEGQKMRHCVFSYKRSCMEGRTGIFSMTSSTPVYTDRRNLTIEVFANSRQLGQVRGFANRLPRSQEWQILHKWANENQLSFRY